MGLFRILDFGARIVAGLVAGVVNLFGSCFFFSCFSRRETCLGMRAIVVKKFRLVFQGCFL